MLRSIDFKTMPYLFTDKAGTCLTVEFDGRELDDIYKQVKAMYDLEHPSDGMPIEPMEPGWYMTRDGEDLLSFDGDAWHIHNLGFGCAYLLVPLPASCLCFSYSLSSSIVPVKSFPSIFR